MVSISRAVVCCRLSHNPVGFVKVVAVQPISAAVSFIFVTNASTLPSPNWFARISDASQEEVSIMA